MTAMDRKVTDRRAMDEFFDVRTAQTESREVESKARHANPALVAPNTLQQSHEADPGPVQLSLTRAIQAELQQRREVKSSPSLSTFVLATRPQLQEQHNSDTGHSHLKIMHDNPMQLPSKANESRQPQSDDARLVLDQMNDALQANIFVTSSSEIVDLEKDNCDFGKAYAQDAAFTYKNARKSVESEERQQISVESATLITMLIANAFWLEIMTLRITS